MKLNNYKEKFILFGGIFGIGAVSLAITLAVYNVQLSSESKINDEGETNIVLNQGLTEAQKIVAQNLVAELEKIESEKIESEKIESEKIESEKIESEKIESEKIENGKNAEEAFENRENAEVANNVVEVSAKVKGVSFIKPLDGEIGMGFSDEDLIYWKTLDEWGVHSGIDILADVGSEVKASADGVVRCIYEDAMYGFTIVLEHDNGYVTRYSGITENDLLGVDKEVKQGEVIAEVSDASGFEVGEKSHLHFEVVKDGVNVEPKFN